MFWLFYLLNVEAYKQIYNKLLPTKRDGFDFFLVCRWQAVKMLRELKRCE